MKPLLINVDIGERGVDHPLDRELMTLIDIANVACGGHAGDAASVGHFCALAERNHLAVAAHISYPDRANFGRKTLNLSPDVLRTSMNRQINLLPDVRMVKFHGALYNEACVHADLARMLAQWLLKRGVNQVIVMPDTELCRSCHQAGIRVLKEAFAERAYAWSAADHRLTLVNRAHAHACLECADEAMEQVRMIVERGQVRAYAANDASPTVAGCFAVEIDTVCIHSDSPIALELCQRMRRLWNALD